MSALSLIVGKRRPIAVRDFAEASAAYDRVRMASGLGMSRLPEGQLQQDGKLVARVSYNGRVWPPEPWFPDMKPLFDNRVGAS